MERWVDLNVCMCVPAFVRACAALCGPVCEDGMIGARPDGYMDGLVD